MVSFKALLVSAILLCGSHVLAATAVSEAASKVALPVASLASQSNVAVSEERGAAVKEQAFDGFDDFLGNIVYPIALDKNCKTLSSISENLAHILDRYTGHGLQCSNELRQIINEDVTCTSSDGTTSLITQVIFPLAFQSLQDMADKIKAQTKCLDALLTGAV